MEPQAWLANFSPEAWIAGAAAVIAFVALFFTATAAKAARDQTKIQRQLRIEASQPYIWVDVREDEASPSLLNFVIGNSGPTVATNVRIRISSPLPAELRLESIVRDVEKRLARGLKSLAPGRVIRWSLGMGFRILSEKGGHAYEFTIDADGPFGPLETLSYTVDMDDWRQMKDSPRGSLHMVRTSIDKMAKQIEELSATRQRN